METGTGWLTGLFLMELGLEIEFNWIKNSYRSYRSKLEPLLVHEFSKCSSDEMLSLLFPSNQYLLERHLLNLCEVLVSSYWFIG
jgi:hypothetical protein